MASPLQLTYSFMWQVIRQRNVKLYGKVEEFITMVTQTVPELMTFKQTAQLLLGLRARVSIHDGLTCVCVCFVNFVFIESFFFLFLDHFRFTKQRRPARFQSDSDSHKQAKGFYLTGNFFLI